VVKKEEKQTLSISHPQGRGVNTKNHPYLFTKEKVGMILSFDK